MSATAGPSRPRPRTHVVDGPIGASDEETRTRELLARLSLQDIEQFHDEALQSTANDDTVSDADLALRLFAEEAQSIARFNSDRAFALSLHEGELPQSEIGQSATALNETRQRLAQRTRSEARPRGWQEQGNARAEKKTWIGAFFTWMLGENTNEAKVPQVTPRPRPTGHNCVICQDPIVGVEVRAPCGHYYDKACVLELFGAATRDESLFPPRCCRQNISLESVRQYMSAEAGDTFMEKAREFGTLKRVYCANPTCSRFLGPESKGFFSPPKYACPVGTCSTVTCAGCKAKVQTGISHHCAHDDEQDRAVLALGERSGWQRCPGCNAMVELNLGCYHMTCRCMTQFCYLCRAVWKSCRCAQWDERRLLAAAEDRVDRELGGGQRQNAHVRPALPPRPAVARAHQAQPAPLQQPVIAQAPRARPAPAPGPQNANHPVHRTVDQVWIGRQVQRPIANEQQVEAPLTRQQLNGTSTTARTRTRDELYQDLTAQHHKGADHNVPPDRSHAQLQRQQLIEETVARLRVDHDCQHTRWKYRQGGGKCENCHFHLKLYLFRCTGCEMVACNRCRRNRL